MGEKACLPELPEVIEHQVSQAGLTAVTWTPGRGEAELGGSPHETHRKQHLWLVSTAVAMGPHTTPRTGTSSNSQGGCSWGCEWLQREGMGLVQRETWRRALRVFLPRLGNQEVNIFLSLERNPSLSSPASGLAVPPAELSMVLPPGHKQQREPGSRAQTAERTGAHQHGPHPADPKPRGSPRAPQKRGFWLSRPGDWETAISAPQPLLTSSSNKARAEWPGQARPHSFHGSSSKLQNHTTGKLPK